MNKPNHVMVRQDEPKSTKAYQIGVGARGTVPNHKGIP